MRTNEFVMQLGLLIEAAGKVQAVIGNALRWGLSNTNPDTGESNREALLRDLDDLKGSIGKIENALRPAVGSLEIRPSNGR